MKLGEILEKLFFSKIGSYALIQQSTLEQDLYEGTDFLYKGWRFDITLKPHKSWCQEIGNYHDMWWGIRVANANYVFKENVIVIGYKGAEVHDQIEAELGSKRLCEELFKNDIYDNLDMIIEDVISYLYG